MKRSYLSAMALAAAAALAGCSALPASAPNVDAGFGASVRQSMSAQVANPNAGRQAGGPDRFDAQSAVSAIARHRDSFKSPPPTFVITGIGSQ